jgi:lipoyl(octanoyl) transferase
VTQPVLRHLPDLTADGPTQMASDEALLEAAQVPTVRLYTWQPSTVSLGYFQDFTGVTAALQARTGHIPPLVRRITGGGAIWHADEVTYALVAQVGTHLPSQPAAIYAHLHGAIREALAARGAHLDRQTATVGDRRYASEPRCFASPAAEDLIFEQGKVLGSAARIRGERILIHGSLKLASNPWDGDVVSGCGLAAEQAAAGLVDGISRALALPLEPGPWTTDETAARDRIRAVRYGDQRWVEKRVGPRA